jgi:hypothetical protein
MSYRRGLSAILWRPSIYGYRILNFPGKKGGKEKKKKRKKKKKKQADVHRRA